MSDDDRIAQLRAEKKRVRADVYDLGVRFNAGETSVRAALDAAIRRSDELEAEIRRLTPQPPIRPAPMYGPPAPRPRPLEPSSENPVVERRRGFFDRLFRK